MQVNNDNYYELSSNDEQMSEEDEDEDIESDIDTGVQTNEDDEMSDGDRLMTCNEDLKYYKSESQVRYEIMQSMEHEKKQTMKEVDGHKQRVSCLEDSCIKQA